MSGPRVTLASPECRDRRPSIDVPFQRLAPETLTRLIEEFVTRDGTDNGDLEHSLADRVRRVRQQLERGEAVISFDPDAETCTVSPASPDQRRGPQGR